MSRRAWFWTFIALLIVYGAFTAAIYFGSHH